MTVPTRNQRLAQKAFHCVRARKQAANFDDYATVARKFPALIHTCGLVQAVAFAQAKRKSDRPEGGPECQYLSDLARVLHTGGHAEVKDADTLAAHCRDDLVSAYLRLSRDSLAASVWLKRYAEALSEDVPPQPEVKK